MWCREKWQHLFVEEQGAEPWWMSDVHIRFLYDLAMVCPEFRNVLEVGSYLGTSASAWVQAMLDGQPLNLACCDTKIQGLLRDTAAKAPRPVTLLEMPGTAAIGRGFDVVILDSDHRIDTTSRELGACLLAEIETIILHDTFATWVEWCNGTVWARSALECHPLYQCTSDGLGIETGKRRWGLTVASRNRKVHEKARSLLSQL